MDGGADIVITSISGYVHILKHLESLGLAENVAGIFPLSASLMQEQKAILESNIEKIIEVYEILSDTKSQEVFTNFLNFRMTRDFSYILGIADGMEHQYFDKEIIKTSSEEVFADCGACNGDTLAEFIRYSRNEFKRIVCFEPNGEMYGELRNRIEELRDNRVAAVQAAVYKESGKLGFAIRGDSTSRIDDSEAVNVVECVGLDDYFGGESCTFIKMDIEGSEADALAGARGTIAKNKPKLAFSVYHKPEDLWALPLLVRSILPEYRVYMRHYGRSYHETVCYACV
jgi:FkbM family methyltransferase